MRVILTGGGTGGHVYPAIAIGQAIFKEWPRTEFLYVGTEAGLEKRILSSTRFPFVSIDVEGIQRKVSFQVFRAAWKALIGLQQAERIIHDFVPHLVIGTGGYVCLPMVWAATRKGIPTIIHEQNALPGLTNRFLSRRVNEVLLTFPEAKERLAKNVQYKAVMTGMPIREEIMQVTRQEGLDYFGFSPGKRTLLCLGGSRGALSINKAMLHICKELKDEVQIVHITGVNGYNSFMQELKSTGINVGNSGNIIIRPYLHHMEYALACADLCVARAGAAFLSEMTTRGIPGVLIPYPYAAENHQEYNAKALREKNAAVILLDKELSGEVLLKQVSEIIFNDQRRNLMAENSKKAGNIEAIEKIIEVVRPYIKK
ncbi:MAG: undecaprenyldiphospho-muramoylpentapeptide beta-N-acetylglucosaminyltransferase [Firmicutes bacterium HGW-Firmicutes-12]|jgi:UDP-N-acetylglucosamine--N-acetylmuramyl-(pentapeptide) pyrophosphoryl-undecaprenol N-acetylglucosamine transferase|nr:MAG: undecaprenyldiphospho-muramoylpentapeptide beta-N-acetylglucosaminyltransferase [Firmicutes bacterium HGW-Firmicutes-12]